jgi:hypothetical protein
LNTVNFSVHARVQSHVNFVQCCVIVSVIVIVIVSVIVSFIVIVIVLL